MQHGHKKVEYVGGLGTAADRIVELARPGDLSLTLGAGSVHQVGDEVLRRLEGV